MTDVLLRISCGATLGLVLVLLLRRPARWLFGAGPSFTLWLLPLVLMLAPLLPQRLTPTAMVVLPGLTVTPRAALAAASQSFGLHWAYWLPMLWAIGAAAGLVRLALHYFRLMRDLRMAPVAWTRALTEVAPNLDARRVRMHDAGPAVLWALPRSLILLPSDFPKRFRNAAMRRLVLRHELTHASRGDALWSLAMEVASALLWFHPLMWLARPRFRLDQELACDAASLRALPQQTASYARALLDSVAVRPAPALIPWLAEPQLKERIAMIIRVAPGALRRRVGFSAVSLLLAGGLYVAGGRTPTLAATQPPATSANVALHLAAVGGVHGSSASSRPSVDITYKNRNPPRYPVDALRNGEQGTVMLRVHVDARGTVTKVDVDKSKTTTTSAELQAAAVTAAESWKFNPGVENGQPSGGWITIPVTFSLKPLPSSQPAPGHRRSELGVG